MARSQLRSGRFPSLVVLNPESGLLMQGLAKIGMLWPEGICIDGCCLLETGFCFIHFAAYCEAVRQVEQGCRIAFVKVVARGLVDIQCFPVERHRLVGAPIGLVGSAEFEQEIRIVRVSFAA